MRRSGFTILELVLVLAVIIGLAGILYPSFAPLYGQYKIAAAADTVRAGLLQARAQAVEEGRPYAFAILPGKGNFRVAPDSPLYWSGSGSTTEDENGVKPFLLEDSLPRGIVFSDKDNNTQPEEGEDTVQKTGETSPSQFKQVIVFMPDGTASADAEISLRRNSSAPMIVMVRSLTGSVTTRRGTATENGGR